MDAPCLTSTPGQTNSNGLTEAVWDGEVEDVDDDLGEKKSASRPVTEEELLEAGTEAEADEPAFDAG